MKSKKQLHSKKRKSKAYHLHDLYPKNNQMNKKEQKLQNIQSSLLQSDSFLKNKNQLINRQFIDRIPKLQKSQNEQTLQTKCESSQDQQIGDKIVPIEQSNPGIELKKSIKDAAKDVLQEKNKQLAKVTLKKNSAENNHFCGKQYEDFVNACEKKIRQYQSTLTFQDKKISCLQNDKKDLSEKIKKLQMSLIQKEKILPNSDKSMESNFCQLQFSRKRVSELEQQVCFLKTKSIETSIGLQSEIKCPEGQSSRASKINECLTLYRQNQKLKTFLTSSPHFMKAINPSRKNDVLESLSRIKTLANQMKSEE